MFQRVAACDPLKNEGFCGFGGFGGLWALGVTFQVWPSVVLEVFTEHARWTHRHRSTSGVHVAYKGVGPDQVKCPAFVRFLVPPATFNPSMH